MIHCSFPARFELPGKAVQSVSDLTGELRAGMEAFYCMVFTPAFQVNIFMLLEYNNKGSPMAILSDNSMKVLQSRYLRRDINGSLSETPDELFHRVAKAVANAELTWGTSQTAELWEKNFYRSMSSLCFLPNSPTLMNAGTGVHQLSTCFVLPVEDNLNSIFTTLKNTALIQKSGGGTGFNFSHIRPKDDFISSTGGNASGPVSFMKIFDAATEHIKQGGKRRGANMGVLNVDHPDIQEFVLSKKNAGTLNNFNLSVGIKDTFMRAVGMDKDWSLVHPVSKEVVKIIKAQELWKEIIESAWQTGDPGLIFLDTINADNPTPALGMIESTNPCGEVPLLSYEPCNLGSLNLSKFVTRNGDSNDVHWKYLEEMIHTGIRFLDDVIEVNEYLLPEIKNMAMGNRKIGLGVMGWAEMLILLQIPYESDNAIRLAENLMQFISRKSMEASEALAAYRSVFPNWQGSRYYPAAPLRNATRTSIAPTGTISIIADTSSSIEPLFALAFKRQHAMNGSPMISVSPLFIQYLEKHHLYSERVKDHIFQEGRCGNIRGLPAHVKSIFKTALEISPSWHLLHQLAFQKFTDNAVSKTINMPENSSRKDVEEVYYAAWQKKAKGITVFRDNSKGKQVLTRGIGSGTRPCRVCLE